MKHIEELIYFMVKLLSRMLIAVVILLIVSLALLKFFNREAFRSPTFESSQLYLTAIGCPEDFWVPLLDRNFDLKKGNDHFEFNFHSVYVGPKDINIATSRNKTLIEKTIGGEGFIPAFKFKIKIYEGEKILWQSETQKNVRPYFTNNEVGFLIGDINCPRDMPLDSNLKLVIDVIKHDVVFEKENSLRLKIINNIKE
jgi:hypothetical protein